MTGGLLPFSYQTSWLHKYLLGEIAPDGKHRLDLFRRENASSALKDGDYSINTSGVGRTPVAFYVGILLCSDKT